MKYTDLYQEELQIVCESLDFTPMKGKSIVITGCSGLIGSSVADILIYANRSGKTKTDIFLAALTQEEIEHRFAPFIKDPYLHYVQYNALKPVNFPFQAEYIIHAASNAHPAAYAKEPAETLMANVSGIRELLNYAHTVGSERVLYISSSEVYGQKPHTDQPYRENDYGYVDILNPRACYPSGKRAAETLCAAYTAEYQVDTVIVRPGHIYGPTMTPSDSRAASQFAREAAAGRNIIMKSAGTQLRSYCYGADCASAILTVLLKGSSAEAYNISNRSSIVSIRQLAQAYAEYAGCRVEFEDASVQEQKSFNLMDNSSLDSQKLEALGWKANFSLKDGVRRTIELLRQQYCDSEGDIF